jgi:hypothetical protein
MKIAATTVLLLSLSGPAVAFEEPEGFKEAKFGDSEQAVRTKLNIPPPTYHPAFVVGGKELTPARTFDSSCLSYQKDMAWAGDRLCSQPNKIGDIPVSVSYSFRDDRLVRISFGFRPDLYPQMKLAFLSRFGTPTDTNERIVKTGSGVEYLNEELVWTSSTLRIFVSKYLNKITESGASYDLLSEIATTARLRREQGSKAAEDLK